MLKLTVDFDPQEGEVDVDELLWIAHIAKSAEAAVYLDNSMGNGIDGLTVHVDLEHVDGGR